eukprot:CAMPEP_0118828058 /NCGR_PEP_ID=MMETSP1162-20130426/16729_1 /TAXON_ID=33656 /ORGANISM="Phaeocystis Sp, Strain CCMP2710" /LENGTH=182 /DNA_ID=CAMNT_0006758985 /DNA_START=122 /DNA_END=669 /DNA_ORIENTATION=-
MTLIVVRDRMTSATMTLSVFHSHSIMLPHGFKRGQRRLLESVFTILSIHSWSVARRRDQGRPAPAAPARASPVESPSAASPAATPAGPPSSASRAAASEAPPAAAAPARRYEGALKSAAAPYWRRGFGRAAVGLFQLDADAVDRKRMPAAGDWAGGVHRGVDRLSGCISKARARLQGLTESV